MTTPATTRFPDNLVSLHSGEEQLRNQSIAATQAAENLSAVESAMDLIDYFCRQYQ
jgi:hypothetical protein